MEGVEAPKSRLEMLEASDTKFSWILLIICYLFIMYIVYSLREHKRCFNIEWKEVQIKTYDGTVLLGSTGRKLYWPR